MSDDREVADRIWDVLVDAEEGGVHPRDILLALQNTQRKWMIENIDRVVAKPGGDQE